jgi:ABC-type nitrate/sulfonate/bicarbonate transport system permease component
LRSADAEVDELFYSLSADRRQRLVKVRFPASLPYLFTALKLAACSCFVGAVVAEWIGSNKGIGYLIVFDSSQYKIAEMWDAVILTALLSMVVYRLVVLAEQRTTPWLPREADDLD